MLITSDVSPNQTCLKHGLHIEGLPAHTRSSVYIKRQDIQNVVGSPLYIGNNPQNDIKQLIGHWTLSPAFDPAANSLFTQVYPARPNYSISGNKLTSLVGSPVVVRGDYNCTTNNLLNLEGAPVYVGGSFNCRGNKLTSLDGIPAYIGEDFNCDWDICGKIHTEEEIEDMVRQRCVLGGRVEFFPFSFTHIIMPPRVAFEGNIHHHLTVEDIVNVQPLGG